MPLALASEQQGPDCCAASEPRRKGHPARWASWDSGLFGRAVGQTNSLGPQVSVTLWVFGPTVYWAQLHTRGC
eukprot:1338951-Alexandrium_andersonii.AAC.1